MKLPRLLLVEDDASIRRFVGMALEDSAIEVVPAPNLKDAVRALRSGPFDVVLCDLMLPDGNGLDLLRALAGADSPSPGARRVAFSAGVSAEQRQHLRAAGVHGVLAKPASLAELLACVQEALAAALSVLVDRGTTIVLITHELGPVEPLFTRAIVLRDGFVVHDGPPLEHDFHHEHDDEWHHAHGDVPPRRPGLGLMG